MSAHLTLENRLLIESELKNGISLRQIAGQLGKAPCTISREIRAHRFINDTGAVGRVLNRCVHRRDCRLHGICDDKPDCSRLCASCKFCNQHCTDFVLDICGNLERAPYVCNGCKNRASCVLSKYLYSARKANDAYTATLRDSRIGFNLTEQELRAIDDTVSARLDDNQSIHHIVSHNTCALIRSERTIYRLVDACVLHARRIDLPRACRFKPRKSMARSLKIDRDCRINRSFQNYHAFLLAHTVNSTVQMDSVIGKVGGKVLLTLHLVNCDFMIAFIRDANTAISVIDVFDFLYVNLGHDDFTRIFPVLLTDNGSEFSCPLKIEFTNDGTRRTNVFYCDPNSPQQKANVELNHEFLRRVLPRGSSFDDLSQENIGLIFSHINSYGRLKFDDKSPIQMLRFIYGDRLSEKVLRLVCQVEIEPEKIILNRSVLMR